MEYKFKDTITKTMKNGVGECKKTRESIKCIDGKCEKVPKSVLVNQKGSGYKKITQDNYKCPMCSEHKNVSELIEHIKTHLPNKKSNINPLSILYPGIKIEDTKYLKFENLRQSGGSQFYGKKSSVMIKVPKSVKNTALYAFKMRSLGFKGGMETGWKRAKQLATKSEISIEDLRYMRAWFARHVYTSYPSYKAWVKAGRPKDDKKWHNKRGILAWLIWSGDAAFKWVNSKKNIKLMNNYFNKLK